MAFSSVLYFVAQIFVAWIWKDPSYSLWTNTISDLGNTVCHGTKYANVAINEADLILAAERLHAHLAGQRLTAKVVPLKLAN